MPELAGGPVPQLQPRREADGVREVGEDGGEAALPWPVAPQAPHPGGEGPPGQDGLGLRAGGQGVREHVHEGLKRDGLHAKHRHRVYPGRAVHVLVEHGLREDGEVVGVEGPEAHLPEGRGDAGRAGLPRAGEDHLELARVRPGSEVAAAAAVYREGVLGAPGPRRPEPRVAQEAPVHRRLHDGPQGPGARHGGEPRGAAAAPALASLPGIPARA
mmetsp:Transcript_96028/g.310062  ORF Transcript_96028/g.310062 Transcript_96028/m.310062 type:complete len:215 (+) Transcript_96028:438-1082(+)